MSTAVRGIARAAMHRRCTRTFPCCIHKLTTVDMNLVVLCRAALYSDTARYHKLRNAGHVAHDDRRRHYIMEEKGRRDLHRRGCFTGDRMHSPMVMTWTSHTAPPQETDKATIDVEAQEDGVMGKILVRLSPPIRGGTRLSEYTLYRLLMARRTSQWARSLRS